MKNILTIVLILATVAGWTQNNLNPEFEYVDHFQIPPVIMSVSDFDVSEDGILSVTSYIENNFNSNGL